MSSLRCCEYRELEGKTIRRVRWSNDLDWPDLGIDFTDQTHVSFKFSLDLHEDGELLDFKGGNLTNPRTLVATPVRLQVKPLEDK
jgi:hypothetical protein